MINDETSDVLVDVPKPGGGNEGIGKVHRSLPGPGVSSRSVSGGPTVAMGTPVVGATIVFHSLRGTGSRRTSAPTRGVAVGPSSILSTRAAAVSAG